ncbi:MAG: HAD hydrolase family protein [Candidatus Fimadaptatus sp.]
MVARQVAAARGIPLERVAAFGDDVNDVEMLRACGVGVAVANALSDVKSAANCICGANDDDGMARWLAENALG